MDEYTIQPSPARASYAPSHRLNVYKNFRHGRMIAWNDFAGTTHANSTSEKSLYTLCGGSTLSGIVLPFKFDSQGLGIQFPGNFFPSGGQVKLTFYGSFTSLVAATEITWYTACYTTSLAENLTLFKTTVVPGDDEWAAWKLDVTYSFFHGSATDFTIRYVTGYGNLELMNTSTGIGAFYPLVPQLSDPSETFESGVNILASVTFDTESANNSITGLGFEVIQYT